MRIVSTNMFNTYIERIDSNRLYCIQDTDNVGYADFVVGGEVLADVAKGIIFDNIDCNGNVLFMTNLFRDGFTLLMPAVDVCIARRGYYLYVYTSGQYFSMGNIMFFSGEGIDILECGEFSIVGLEVLTDEGIVNDACLTFRYKGMNKYVGLSNSDVRYYGTPCNSVEFMRLLSMV